MKTSLVVALVVLATGAGLGAAIAARGPQSARGATLTAVPATAGAVELLDAIPFALDEPFVHEWRAEKPLATAGWLLKLRVDPELAVPRQTFEPVLYVGSETAERCLPEIALVPAVEGGLAPVEQGLLVVLVPAPLGADGRVDLDLESAPIWFGSLELPERVDAARIAAELAAGRASGAGKARRVAGLDLGAAAERTVRARTRAELEPYVADLYR